MFKVALKILPVLIALILFSTAVNAEGEYSYSADDFGADKIEDSIPDEISDLLPDNGDLFAPENITEYFSLQYFFNMLLKILKELLSPVLKLFAALLSMLVLSSVLKALFDFSNSGTAAFELLLKLTAALTVFSGIAETFTLAGKYLGELSSLSSVILPSVTAASVAGGNTATAALASSAVGFALALLGFASSSFLFPVVKLLSALSLSETFCFAGLGGISRKISAFCSGAVAFVSVLLCSVMSFQSSVAAKTDSLSMRSIRFAASSLGGGLAGDSIATVAGGLSLIKSSVGSVGVFIIILLTLPVLLRILLQKAALSVSGAFADMLGLPYCEKMLSSLCSVMNFLLTVCIASSLCLIYMFALLCSVSPAIL